MGTYQVIQGKENSNLAGPWERRKPGAPSVLLLTGYQLCPHR